MAFSKLQSRYLIEHSGCWHVGCIPSALKGGSMLYWAAVFFIIALIAAVFGFGGIAASAAGVAKILFVVFLVLAVISLLLNRRVVT
jgi:uncharacterized membrane protein YtjA (UPF0391 family)